MKGDCLADSLNIVKFQPLEFWQSLVLINLFASTEMLKIKESSKKLKKCLINFDPKYIFIFYLYLRNY